MHGLFTHDIFHALEVFRVYYIEVVLYGTNCIYSRKHGFIDIKRTD